MVCLHLFFILYFNAFFVHTVIFGHPVDQGAHPELTLNRCATLTTIKTHSKCCCLLVQWLVGLYSLVRQRVVASY